MLINYMKPFRIRYELWEQFSLQFFIHTITQFIFIATERR